MRSSFLPRSLLASAVALTLSYAAVVDKRQTGTNCGHHVGWIKLIPSWSAPDYYVKTAGNAYFFSHIEILQTKSAAASFRFDGCMGGPPIHLYCTSCDPSGNAIAGSRSTAYDAKGEPTNFLFYNAGPDASYIFLRDSNITDRPIVHDGTVYSLDFTWGKDDLIRPVTYNQDESNQGILYNTWYDGDTTEISFMQGTVGGHYYYLWWEEAV